MGFKPSFQSIKPLLSVSHSQLVISWLYLLSLTTRAHLSLPSLSVLSFTVKYISLSLSVSLSHTERVADMDMVRRSSESKMWLQFPFSIKKGLDLIFSISRLEALTHISLNHASPLS
ncbi:hypothetical protein Syun_006893 [Stephania yunnanensis]|uniref:Uncharacterized protein n=1 Tax=Stephania yunnanensis TaxID=152371 RepID=A0AAP0PXZ7_9MAGN